MISTCSGCARKPKTVTCEERIDELQRTNEMLRRHIDAGRLREQELAESIARKASHVNYLRGKVAELSKRVAVLEGNQFPERWN
jgi:hypothetical protein